MPTNQRIFTELNLFNETRLAAKFRHTNDTFPCLIKNGEEIENLDEAANQQEKYHRVARNALRHLTYGKSFNECKLLTWSNFKALFIQRDSCLLRALRKEVQNIFLNILTNVEGNHFDESSEMRLGILIDNLLSIYPFLDPEDNEETILPQTINNRWERVNYHFEKIDISPKSGPLAKLIEDQDRLFAYGLTPEHRQAQPHLLFMGTTYPAGQGADLNWLYNFSPFYSVGEGHDTSLVEHWLANHTNVKICGHSKGGTMAMIIAAKFPQNIHNACCLNPTALRIETIKRLEQQWSQIPNAEKPIIEVYTQANDPVFLLENNFLESTIIYRLGKVNDKSSLFAAHANYFAGKKSTLVTEVTDIQAELVSRRREFFTDIKKALNVVMFPYLYSKLVCKTCSRKLKRFFNTHAFIIKAILFLAAIVTGTSLLASGIYTPLIAPIALKIGVGLTYGLAAATNFAIGVISTYVVPKVINYGSNLLLTVASAAISISGFLAALILGGILSSLKIAIISVYSTKASHIIKPNLQQNAEQAIKPSSSNSRSSYYNLIKRWGTNNYSINHPTPSVSMFVQSKSEPDLYSLNKQTKLDKSNEISSLKRNFSF